MEFTKLECTSCRYTIEVSKWNERLKDSITLGVANELIPEEITASEWNEKYPYEHEASRADCPECGEVCLFSDMEAY